MDGYQGYHFPILRGEQLVSAGATNEVIDVGPVPTGSVWVIPYLSVEDETTAFTSFRVGVLRSGNVLWFLEQRTPLSGTLYWLDQPLHLPEGCSLRVRFTGTTAADRLQVNLNGFEVMQGRPA